MSAVGSYAWALQTGGRLRTLDSVRLTAIALRAQLYRKLTRHAQAKAAQRLAALNLDDIQIPDSAAARQALEACRSTELPYLLNHCVRTYLYGAMLGAAEGLRHDAEFLYCAALLHDISIANRHTTGQALRCQCFAHQSAAWSLRWATQQGWAEERAANLADAISRHINPAVPLRDGVEAHLLNRAAALDVAGVGRHTVPKPLRDALLARWPRLDQNEALARFMTTEAQACQQGRVGWLARHGFIDRITTAK